MDRNDEEMSIKTYTPAGVAKFLGVSKKTILAAIKSGALPAVRYNERVIRITATDCAVWYAARGGKLKAGATGTTGTTGTSPP